MDFKFAILYVEDTATSAAFYADLLGRPPVEATPTFAMLPLSGGTMLGLWSRQTVAPAAQSTSGSSELTFTVGDAAALQALHDDWKARGITILQHPTRMDFGDTFMAADPDGHRLRVMVAA